MRMTIAGTLAFLVVVTALTGCEKEREPLPIMTGTGGGQTGAAGSGGSAGSPNAGSGGSGTGGNAGDSGGCAPADCKNRPIPAIGCANGTTPVFTCARAANGVCNWTMPRCDGPMDAGGGKDSGNNPPSSDASAGPICGKVVCPSGQVCCNASCGICTPPGGGCITLACPPSVDAGPPGGGACTVDSDCRLFDDYCTGCDCRALARSEPDPTCSGPGVKCLVQPCANKAAVCKAGRCVVTGGTAASPTWQYTCGDPQCQGWRAKPGVPDCSAEQPMGGACKVEGESCDPRDNCNRRLVCSSKSLIPSPGGCPISRRSTKRDIHYLSSDELRSYHDQLLQMKLATWRYKHDPARERLGFILDDEEENSVAVDAPRDMVDLYGYTSLAVATLQLQAHELRRLQAELDAVHRRLDRLDTRASAPNGRPRASRK